MWAYAGFNGMKEIWPAIAVAGVTFAIPQYLVSNHHGPWLTDIIAAVCSMVCLILFLKIWYPKQIWGHQGHQESEQRAARSGCSAGTEAVVGEGTIPRRDIDEWH
ncbi:MAG TPA: L-lactate permease [Terriglobales bacterium]|nr:L-lactate permease [Terriglobales bacterium]